ncbi:HAMP domain-containing protein, partial [Rhodovulum sp. PH10]|uniref:HAMP domain-containing protein n=1 Tax=Rhodovulum sp. PH10 TaxID=1187851 RepID=UPI00058DB376
MRFTIKLKLGLAFAFVIALSAATAWLGISNLGAADKAMRELVDGPAQRLENTMQRNIDVVELIRAEKNYLLASNPADAARYEQRMVERQRDLMKKYDVDEAASSGAGKSYWANIRSATQQLGAVEERIRAAVQQGNPDGARELSNTEARRLADEIEQNFDKLTGILDSYLKEAKQEASDATAKATFWMLIALGAALVVGVGTATWIAMSISRSLGRAGALAQAVAGGDLTQTIDKTSKDEIGELVEHVNTMVLRLRQVVSEALGASDNVSAGSQQLSSSAEQLSEGATEQAASAEEASSSMEEMAANIKQNADNASQT